MDSARLTFLFYRYVNQTCTEVERKEFLRLISQPDYEVQVKDLMKDLWETVPPGQLSRVKAEEIVAGILAPAEVAETTSAPWWAGGWMKAAAVATIAMLSSVAVYYVSNTFSTEQTANAKPLVPPSEHQIIKLPDGSVVILNAGSTLEFPDSFDGKETRTVFLQGEGYFDVQHDPTKKFVVQTGNLKTTVLGTAFNIKAYPMDKNITVTVTRGKVKVSDDKKFLGIITPDQQISFDKHYQAAERQTVDAKTAIAWAEKDIFFDDITVADAVRELERRFDVTVGFSNERLKDCRFTATFVRGENLDQILTVICEFNGSHFRRDEGGTIHIEGGGC